MKLPKDVSPKLTKRWRPRTLIRKLCLWSPALIRAHYMKSKVRMTYQRRKSCWPGKKKVKKPCCRSTAHGGHLAAAERHAPGGSLSPSAQAVANLQSRRQRDRPLSRGADLPALTHGEAWVDRGSAQLSDDAWNANWRMFTPKPGPRASIWFPSQKPAETAATECQMPFDANLLL
jgi:hypothetical protein